MSNDTNPRQMSIVTTNKAVVELMNKLKMATPGQGSHLHRYNEDTATGGKQGKSLIGINLVDYASSPSIFVQDNLEPSQVKELYNEAIMKRNNYTFSGSGQKIFGEPDKDGFSFVRVLRISRQGSFKQGDRVVTKTYPWKIAIENGRGIKIKTKTGGTACKEGSYKKEKSAEINLSDGDFFALLDQAYTYLIAWENYVAHSFIRANEEKIYQMEEQWRKR